MATVPISATVMPEEERNSLVIGHLTSKVGVEAVRKYFDRIVLPTNLSAFLNTKKKTLQGLPKKILYTYQYNLLFPPQGGIVNSKDFDITLMACLIRNTFNVKQPSTGWDVLPHSNDLTDIADVFRIKYYRNKCVAHRSSHQLSNADYNKHATDIKNAISRLSNTSLDAAAENILDMKIVPSEYLDSLTDVIPRHIRKQNTAITTIWRREKRNSFVETRAYRHARDQVKKNNFTTIIGNSGSGKSTIAHGVALELEMDGYIIVPIKTVEDIKTYSDPESKQVFVLDDPIGTVSVEEVSLDHFQSYNQLVNDIVTDSQIKVVITCRKALMNNKRVQTSHTIVSRNIVDINHIDLRLTLKERTYMFNHYVKHIEVKLLRQSKDSITRRKVKLLKQSKDSIIIQDIDNFPLVCRLYSCNDNFRKLGEAFFENMFKHLINELELIQSQHSIQFCCFVLCLFYNNDFDTEILDTLSDSSEEDKSKLNQIIEASGLSSNVSRQEIQTTMEGLVDVYFKKTGTRFRFLHDAIYDSVSFVFGSQHPNKTLKVCSSSFIRERVVLIERTDQMCIVLKRKHFGSLTERLFKELERGNFYDVFLYPFITELQEQLIERFKSKPPHEICTMLESNWDLYKNRITPEIELSSWEWYFLDILSSNNTKLMHWILATGLLDLFTFVYEQYTNFRSVSIGKSGLNLLPIACLSGNIEITKMLLNKENKRVLLDKWDACYYDTDLSTLHMAVFSKNETMVKFVINETLLTCKETEDGRTPLYVGAVLGVTGICRILIEYGADVNKAQNSGATPLYVASGLGQLDTVYVLIDKGADVNMTKNNGCTPLYIASQNGNIDIVKVLIDKCAGINMARDDGRTPLFIASQIGNIEIVNFLTGKGADHNIADNSGCTPLIVSCQNNHIDIVKFLIGKGADVNMNKNNGCTPLIIASQNGHIDIVNVLIGKGAYVNMAKFNGCTPLFVASRNNHIDIVNVLIDKDADFNIAKNNGCTPLIIASQNGHIDIVNVLIGKGAYVNMAKFNGCTSLFIASRYNHIDIAKILIDKGADVNMASNDDGCTPLLLASHNDQIDIVNILIYKGAEVNKALNDGRTPLYIASQNGHSDIVNVLIENRAVVNMAKNDGSTPLYTASLNGHIDIVNVLINKGSDINMSDNDACTPLLVAYHQKHIDIVKVLINKGADVNMASNDDGCTPLLLASNNDQIDIVKILIDKGADVNMASNDGCTPLLLASRNDNIDIVNILIYKGAEVNKALNDGRTPLYIASLNGHSDIVNVLIENCAVVNMAMNDVDIASPNGHSDIVNVPIENCAVVNMAMNDVDIASLNGHSDIVNVRIENCAVVNMAMNDVDIASPNGHSNIVNVPIENRLLSIWLSLGTSKCISSIASKCTEND